MTETSRPSTHAGSVIWYATGRFYTDTSGNSFDVGYFPVIKGIEGPYFSNETTQDETTAYFTFSAEKFSGQAITNGDVSMGIYPPGRWHLYMNATPCGDFTAPESFSKGIRIATFRREGTTGGMQTGTSSVSVLTFELLESAPFEFGNQQYNMKDIVPYGATQIGYGSASLQPGLPEYPQIKCFAGTATNVNSRATNTA